MPWFEIDELYYKGLLPDDIKRMRRAIREANNDFSGIDVCIDYDTAVRLLHVSNSVRPESELIGVWSEHLATLKGSIHLDPSRIKWLGYDIVAPGEQSLIRDGLFTAPSTFQDLERALNQFGLFSSVDSIEEYIRLYDAAALQGFVEPLIRDTELADRGYGITAIRVGNISLPT